MVLVRLIAAALLILGISFPVSAQQARREAAATDWNAVVVKTPQGGFRQGNPNAAIQIVEYGSRTCPTCGAFAAEGVEELRREWIATGKANYEFRDLLIHGAPDFALALLNQCVPTPRFFTVLDAMFANQAKFDAHALEERSPKDVQAWQQLPPAQAATRFAEALNMIPFMRAYGISDAQARACLSNNARIGEIAKVQKLAADYRINSTPTFFINGRRVRAFTWDQLQPELRAVAQ